MIRRPPRSTLFPDPALSRSPCGRSPSRTPRPPTSCSASSWARTSRPAAASSPATPRTSASSTSSGGPPAPTARSGGRGPPDVHALSTNRRDRRVTETPARDRVEPVDLQQEMQRSYIDYAMSVIVGRALPEVRDGLKPVHRRVLFAMYDQGFRPDRGYVKCARVVGEVMGNYHPLGDSSIYDALVRLAQPWSMRYPLVDGQGNFGSPGNDPAAAMRYTEARLTPLAMEMLANIDEETVDFQPNYDGKNQEPLVLPGRIPNLLINGSAGIAVGMATNMPPHNLREVAAAVFWMLEHPEAEAEEALTACMERVKGP